MTSTHSALLWPGLALVGLILLFLLALLAVVLGLSDRG
jgi:hypothetical protein